MNSIHYRPHHFMCTLGFQGKGYSSHFVENFQAIADVLRSPSADGVVIEVTDQTDSICTACPHKDGVHCGSNPAKINLLDSAHAKALGLKHGDRITWGEAKQRMRERVDDTVFERICEGCEWKPLGICLEALRALRG